MALFFHPSPTLHKYNSKCMSIMEIISNKQVIWRKNKITNFAETNLKIIEGAVYVTISIYTVKQQFKLFQLWRNFLSSSLFICKKRCF
jgi:hypothetical protein